MPRVPHNKAADHAVRFIENLTLVGDYSGKPFELMPFQERIIRTLFGAQDKQGKRLIRRCFLMLPRSSAKTTLASAIILYWLLGMGKQGVQAFSCANSRLQASIIFETLKQIIENDDELKAVADPVATTKRITVQGNYSYYQACSSESKTKTGTKPSICVIDEGQDITDGDLIKNLTSGYGARDDYLTLFIGTAGTRKDTAFYAEYEYATKWLEGIVTNPHYAAFIYQAPEGAAWDDEKTWRKAMPAYGVFTNPQFIRDECELAKKLPHKQAEFEQYYLNRWQVGSAAKWLNDKQWMTNNAKPLGDAPYYVAGLDVASVEDSSSLVLFGQNSNGTYDVIPFVWVCEAQIERRQTADFDYLQWAKQGYMRVTPGEVQDQEQIFHDIQEIANQYPIKRLVLDRWGTQWLGQKVSELGCEVNTFGQGFKSMSPALKQLQKLTLSKQLAHGGNPVLRWMMSNVAVDRDHTENLRITKSKSQDKVDAIVALAMACGAYAFEDDCLDETVSYGSSPFESPTFSLWL